MGSQQRYLTDAPIALRPYPWGIYYQRAQCNARTMDWSFLLQVFAQKTHTHQIGYQPGRMYELFK
jgi:hypothetical protein